MMEPMNKEQQLGVILEKLSDTADSISRLEDRFNKLEARVDDKFRTAENFLKFLKFLGFSLVAILTFKFGDISKLWNHLFG